MQVDLSARVEEEKEERVAGHGASWDTGTGRTTARAGASSDARMESSARGEAPCVPRPRNASCAMRRGPSRPSARNEKTAVWRGPVCPWTQEAQGKQVPGGDRGVGRERPWSAGSPCLTGHLKGSGGRSLGGHPCVPRLDGPSCTRSLSTSERDREGVAGPCASLGAGIERPWCARSLCTLTKEWKGRLFPELTCGSLCSPSGKTWTSWVSERHATWEEWGDRSRWSRRKQRID